MNINLLARLADRLILEPSTHEIPVKGKLQRFLPHDGIQLEVWIQRIGPNNEDAPDLYILKFPGTASRAEHFTEVAASCWPNLCVEIWAVNPPGYGSSGGKASLRNIPSMASTALNQIRHVAEKRPVVVVGNSLGCVSALFLAANDDIDGVLLQNPPALREMIRDHFGWWYMKILTAIIASQIKEELNSIRNAAHAKIPAVFIMSQQDQVVPAKYQQMIIDAYAGNKRVLVLPDADHGTPLSEQEVDRLQQLANWLRDTF